jgi:hypothetical protein
MDKKYTKKLLPFLFIISITFSIYKQYEVSNYKKTMKDTEIVLTQNFKFSSNNIESIFNELQEKPKSSNYILLSNSIQSNIILIHSIISINKSSIDYELLNSYKKARLNSNYFTFFYNLNSSIDSSIDSKNFDKLNLIENIWINFKQSIINDIDENGVTRINSFITSYLSFIEESNKLFD